MDFPTPLTPTMEMTYGRRFCNDKVEGEVTLSISRKRSNDDVGVRIFLNDDSIAVWIFACIPTTG